MPHLPILKPNQLVRIVKRQGFVKDRQSGSHMIFKHPDGRWISVPMHRKTVGKGLLHKILKDIQVSVKELNKK